MNGLREELGNKWEESVLAGASDREWRGRTLAIGSPLRLLAAVRERDNRLALLLEARMAVAPRQKVRFLAEGVGLLDQRRPEEDVFRLAVTLERDELRDVFEVLVMDLVDVAAQASSEAEAIATVIARLEAWQACLRSRRQGMTRSELLGLFGELTILQFVAEEAGFTVAIEAWKSPLDGVHDFDRLGFAIEVKATSGIDSLLAISGFEQLDTTALSALAIARLRFREAPEGASLPDLIDNLRASIDRSAPAARSLFEERLLQRGWLPLDRETLGEPVFALQDLYGFDIREGFPRLTSACVPIGIVNGTYTVAERAAATFRISEADLRRIARRLGGT